MTYKFYDFFAGGGMVSQGLGASWHCLFANDIDERKATVYRENRSGGEELLVRDIAKVRLKDMPGIPDLVWASFPCQDLSLAGSGAGLSGKRSETFWPFWRRVIRLIKDGRGPNVIILENVVGALTSHDGKDFATICSTIAKQGYRLGAMVVDAVHFVPQSRPRLFIVAIAPELDIPKSILSERPNPNWHPSALVKAQLSLSSRAQSNWNWLDMPTPRKRNTAFVDLIEDNPSGVEWHTAEQTDYILSLMSERHLAKVRSAKAKNGKVVGAIYRRTRPDGNGGKVQRAEVRFDDVSGCLRTPRGGSSRQTILLLENGRMRSRLLSPREAARLMGLDDRYWLPENYNAAYHVAGDGVAPPVVRHLATHIIEPVLKGGVLLSVEAA